MVFFVKICTEVSEEAGLPETALALEEITRRRMSLNCNVNVRHRDN